MDGDRGRSKRRRVTPSRVVLAGAALLLAAFPLAALGGQEKTQPSGEAPQESTEQTPGSAAEPGGSAGSGSASGGSGSTGGAGSGGSGGSGDAGDRAGSTGSAGEANGYRQARLELVRTGVEARGVTSEQVLEAMRTVPRHEFVPPQHRDAAYQNRPLPIGEGQTISQPYIVGYMTEQLQLEPSDKVLEIGTGSAYQAAILAEIVDEVYTIEIIDSLAESAEERLARLGYDNVSVRNADGYFGWEEHAPFDAIIVTAAAGHIPPPLTEQLAVGGRMVIPLGGIYETQSLVLARKPAEGDIRTEHLLAVRFVPMTGEVRDQ